MDTFRHVISADNEPLTVPRVWDGTGVSDTIKASDKRGVVIQNQTFVGTPSENDIDLVRGSDATIGPNFHFSSPGAANVVIKGCFDGAHISGDFGTAELGQYSIYDQWFALPPTSNITFSPDARGHCTLWRCEIPKVVPPGVTIERKNACLVYAYFLFRSLQQMVIGF